MGDDRLDIQISVVSDDWAMKGCHVHLGALEIAIRPTHLGDVVFRPVFASDDPGDVRKAGEVIRGKFEDPRDPLLTQVTEAVQRAMEHLPGIRGGAYTMARGRLAELSRLKRILYAMSEGRR